MDRKAEQLLKNEKIRKEIAARAKQAVINESAQSIEERVKRNNQWGLEWESSMRAQRDGMDRARNGNTTSELTQNRGSGRLSAQPRGSRISKVW